ncbi:MAG TPA: HepT-like ribonuclease domain-containing protein [Longimicrobium sp.]
MIGEATKNLPESFRAAHPEIEWRSMARMRDRLIHGYFGVDHELVWEVIQTKVPALHERLEQILTE